MKNKSININYILTCFLMLYPLFALTSIKSKFTMVIDGVHCNNLVYIIAVFLIIKFFTMKKRKSNIKMFIVIVFFLLYLVAGNMTRYNNQTAYSILLIILPLMIASTANLNDGKKFNSYIKFLVILGISYSLFTIFEYFFYNNIAAIFNLKQAADYVTRHHTILGSSITTSYYILMNIPLAFIGIKQLDEKWRKYCILSIIISVFAVVLLQSRMAFLVLGGYTIFYFFFFGKKVKWIYKVLIIIGVVGVMIWVFNSPRLNRLYSNYSDDISTKSRFSVLNIGYNKFLEEPLFGSGISKYYIRLWNSSSQYVYINDRVSLIDPHNLYIFVLVEQGIVGLLFYMIVFTVLIKEYIKYLPKYVKINFYILLIAQLFVYFGGSQLINEINFSTLFWCYIMIFCSGGLYERNKEATDNIICSL